MPPKGQKKGKEDTGNPAASQDVETDLDDTDLRPFERLMLNKLDKLDSSLKNISDNVSKLTNHVLKKSDITGIVDVLKDNNKQSNNAMKEMVDTMKTFQKQNESITNSQPQSLQAESTQIFLEQESRKIKQSIIEKWNQNLTKRRTEFWQQIRNDNTSKVYETWKESAPMVLPRKFQMKAIEGEPLAQVQRREKQVKYNFQTEKNS